MSIIFLDVDGVLNSLPYNKNNKEDISDYHLQQLAKIYHTCNAKIVLSSTWRETDIPGSPVYWLYEYLIKELGRYNMEIVSKTPIIDMNRPLEIKTWLDENSAHYCVDNYVILDDDFPKDKYDKYGLGNHLVKTEFFVEKESDGGLQPIHVEKAIKILKGSD